MRNGSIPKTIQRWIDSHPELVLEYWMEPDEFGDSHEGRWSIWLYLKRGYWCRDMETHCIHEATAKAFIEMVASIEPCHCETCEEMK